jgi:two-component system nitrate/nitrite sensor histidine kinase NarX
LALVLSLQQQQDQSCRFALLQERHLIADELHDSLAQSLTYLKTQANRLLKCLARHD